MFYPEDNNIIIIGKEDGSILIYTVQKDMVSIYLAYIGHSQDTYSDLSSCFIQKEAEKDLKVYAVRLIPLY